MQETQVETGIWKAARRDWNIIIIFYQTNISTIKQTLESHSAGDGFLSCLSRYLGTVGKRVRKHKLQGERKETGISRPGR